MLLWEQEVSRRKSQVIVRLPARESEMGQWKQKLFGCFGDSKACFYGFLCGGDSERHVFAWLTGTEDHLCCDACILGGLCCCSPVTVYVNRRLLRSKYSLPGSPIVDCAVASFCTCCAICQHRSEMLDRHGEVEGGVIGGMMNIPAVQKMEHVAGKATSQLAV
mmetsp:Transcript_23202/g.39845  ORF Transcript_23202/g.39845 Transcript_23202/m.39845 type:complete len:163 (-) Transcript_23202:422-910(-)